MFRARLILLLTLLVAACGPGGGREAFVDSRLPPSLAPRFWAPQGWSWGLIKLKGEPAMRYGVAAPGGADKGDLVILTGHGETAEGWFETVRALVGEGYTVWVLESVGEGGSARYRAPRDLAYAPDFDANIDGLRALAAQVVRGGNKRPLFILASGSAAPAALAAVARGLPAKTVILSSPLGAEAANALSGERWHRPAEDADLRPRPAAQQAWMLANPDLRMAGVTRGWKRAYGKLLKATTATAARASVGARVLILAPDPAPDACAALAACRTLAIDADGPYPLAADPARSAWFSAVTGALAPDHGS